MIDSMAMRILRSIGAFVWLAALAVRLCLPAWDVCLHRDGQVCGEAVPRSCCGGDASHDEPVDEDCADCTDLHLQPGASPHRAPTGSLASSGGPMAILTSVPASVLLSGPSLARFAPGVGPPDEPGRRSLPLRC